MIDTYRQLKYIQSSQLYAKQWMSSCPPLPPSDGSRIYLGKASVSVKCTWKEKGTEPSKCRWEGSQRYASHDSRARGV